MCAGIHRETKNTLTNILERHQLCYTEKSPTYVLRSAVGMTHVLRSGLVMGYVI